MCKQVFSPPYANCGCRAYFAGKIPTAALELKAVQLKNGKVGITFSAPTNPKGQIFNPKTADSPKHTGVEYSTHPIRVWDTWNPYYRFSLYYTTIAKQSDGRWKLSAEDPINALKGTKLRYPYGAGGALGEGGSYTIGPHGVLLCSPKPGQNTALTYLSGAYFIRLDSFEEKKPKVIELKTPEYVGTVDAPAFSPDGKTLAFVVARTKYTDRSKKGIAVFNIDDEEAYEASHATTKLIKFADGKKTTWDRFPGDLIWSHDSKRLYIKAEDLGYVRLFSLNLITAMPSGKTATNLAEAPQCLIHDSYSLNSIALLNRNNTSGNKLLLTFSSYTEPSLYTIFDLSTGESRPISSISNYGANLGLKPSQIESITFPGDKSDVQAFIVRPSFFNPKKKYPIALLVHGGPQGAWNSSWSTRWNPTLWAEQGYVVLLPNPSGSSGFGLEIYASVQGDWGGRPYRDIVKSVEYIEKKLDYVDPSNIIMAGGSYGGYMANWIAGHPLAKRLKCLVCHDGVFHTASMLASDFVAGIDQDVGSHLWDDIRPWEKWSPANYVKDWTTPMLIIHSEKDFRCPLNEGLGAYAALQAKGVESRFLYFPDESEFFSLPFSSPLHIYIYIYRVFGVYVLLHLVLS